MKANVLIVTERGLEVGLGHYSRSSRIYAHLSSHEHFSASMIVVSSQKASIAEDKAVVTGLNGLSALMVEWFAKTERPKIVVLDAKSREVMSVILGFRDQHEEGVKICVIDRWEFPSSLIDFWFVPSFFNRFLSGEEPACDWCFGWDCVLLPEYQNLTNALDEDSIFVNFGSSAHLATNSRILEEIVSVTPQDWKINLVLGEYTKVAIPRDILNLVVHRNLAELGELQQNSSVGFSVYGVTLFELFQCGVASVTFSNYSKLEKDEVDELGSSGLTLVARNPREVGLNVGMLIRDKNLRKKVGLKAQRAAMKSGFETLTRVLAGL